MEKERELYLKRREQLLKKKQKKLKEIKSLLALTCGLSGTMLYAKEIITEAKESEVQFEVETYSTSENPVLDAQEIQNSLLNMRTDQNSVLGMYVKELSDTFHLSSEEMLDIIFNHIVEIKQSENQMETIFQIIYQEKFGNVKLQGEIGYAWSEQEYQAFLQTYEGQLSYNAAISYGIDPHLMVALEKAESGLDHYQHIDPEKNAAYGITQQERTNINPEKVRTAKNFKTGNVEEIQLTEDNFKGLETNVRLGAMELRYALEHGNYDISFALDIYNKGFRGATEFRQGKDVSGNPNYVYDVLRYCTSPIITNQIDDNTLMTTNLITGESFTYQANLYDETKEAGIESIVNQYVKLSQELIKIQEELAEFINPFQTISEEIGIEVGEKSKVMTK